jgi:predicted transcriptional regulator
MTTLSDISLANILSVRKRRLSLQREADLLEQEEKTLTGQLINEMDHLKQTVRREGDDEVRLIVTIEPMVAVGGWPAVLDYIIANKATDLFQKRLTASAVKARWDEGEVIVGIEKVHKHSLKFNV